MCTGDAEGPWGKWTALLSKSLQNDEAQTPQLDCGLDRTGSNLQ